MNQEDRDSDLRLLFQELRRQEEYVSPSFKKLWRNGQRSKRLKSPQLWRVAAVLSLGVGLALLAYFAVREFVVTPVPHSQPQSISKWKAPTDFLLQTPGIEILSSTPTLTAPIPNYQLPLEEKGVQR